MPRPGSDAVLLVTGFPSLYARRMIEHILAEEPGAFIYVVVETKHAPAAQALLSAMITAHRERVAVLEGSPTAMDLGLSGAEIRQIRREIDRIHHMVHTSDATADKKTAFAMNVVSTAEILEIARISTELKCLVMHSTAAVSGERQGVVYEADLDEGQSFRSVVAETRMRAESLARRAMRDLPIAIVRPTTIIGGKISVEAPLSPKARPAPKGAPNQEPIEKEAPNEREPAAAAADGAPAGPPAASAEERTSTIPAPPSDARLEGIYLLVLLLIATPADLTIPLPGRTGDVPLHVVPLDYVVRAAHAIGRHPEAPGRTFHLADPSPPSARRVIELVSKASRQRPSRGRVPSDLAKILLRTPGIDRFVRSPRAFVEGLMLPVRYDTRNSDVALSGTGIACPPFESYVEELVAAVQDHIRKRRERRVNALEVEVDDPLS
jgi:nucleoside-diphosphate-sugar epimerase